MCVKSVWQNIVTDASGNIFLKIIGKLQLQGEQGVILRCMEMPLNTTDVDCEAAVAFAIED